MSENGEVVGHLPKEISRITKYFLDRGVSMYDTLSSEHYRHSPLVQVGLEIACQVVIKTRATMLQARLARHYLDLVKDLYAEPTEDRVVGNLFNFVLTLRSTVVTPQGPVKRKAKSASTTVSRNWDIREMFAVPKKKKTQNVMVIDDD